MKKKLDQISGVYLTTVVHQQSSTTHKLQPDNSELFENNYYNSERTLGEKKKNSAFQLGTLINKKKNSAFLLGRPTLINKKKNSAFQLGTLINNV